MKKIKTILSAVLASAAILSLTACDEEVPVSSGSSSNAPGGGTTAPATTIQTTTYERDEDVISAVEGITDQLDNPDLKVTKRIKWLAWGNWEQDETSPAGELFKKTYGIPETGDDPTREGRIFDFYTVPYGDRYTKLASMITADESPDLFPFEALDFPYGVLQRKYQPIDEIINLDSPKWAASKDLMELYKLNGRYYCAFYSIAMQNLMFYKKSNIENIGAENPRELFDAGKWDWDAFLEISRKWQQSGDDKYCLDGYNPENEIVISTGVPMVGNDGTKLYSNLHSTELEKAIGLLQTLQQENLRYPRHEKNNWQVNPYEWGNDNVLFYANGGTWIFEEMGSECLGKTIKKMDLYDDIECVPMPKAPFADKYYTTLKQDAMMWCVGSKNPEGVAAWIDCCVTASQDPEVRAASKKQQKERFNWSDYNLDFIYSLTALDGTSPVTPIADFKGGLGTVSDGSSTRNPIQSLTNMVYLAGESFTELRATHEAQILDAIDQINSAIKS